MGQYSINIFDNKNLEAVTLGQYAERYSIKIRYNGGREKIRNILGSDLYFRMEVSDFSDAKFLDLYTNDERRYQVQLTDEQTGGILWNGYLLPDQYREPIASGAFYVEFVATDGLGTLKGYYLPDKYYIGEHSIITIVINCLSLTGLNLPIYVSPALSNYNTDRWDLMYIDGVGLLDSDGRKKTAYDILVRLLGLNMIFQESNAWYIYGFNKKNATNLTYQHYNYTGNFQGYVSVVKSPKNAILLGSPVIEVNTPRKQIKVYNDIDQGQISKDVFKPQNNGYILNPSDDILVSPHWTYTNVGFTAKFNPFKGPIYLAPLIAAFDASKYVQLRDKLLVLFGQKVQFIIEVRAGYSGTESFIQSVEDIIASNLWKKVCLYEIYREVPGGTDVVLYSNVTGSAPDDLQYQLDFSADRTSSVIIEFIAPTTAYYNLRFYQPVGNAYNIKIDSIELVNIEGTILGDTQVREWINTSDGNFTLNEEMEIQIHDDFQNLPGLIRFAKLQEPNGFQYDVSNLLLSVNNLFNYGGDYFIILPIYLFFQAKNNPQTITVNGAALRPLNFIYNYLGGTEMVMQYDPAEFGAELSAGQILTVTLREVADLPSDIFSWTLWADDIYKTTFKRYGEAAADVLQNLYKYAHPLLNATCEGFLSPRDLIQYSYNGSKTWYLLDCEILLDQGETNFIASENFYGQSVSLNLPPSVDAGPDITLAPTQSEVTVTATASDPENSPLTVLWQFLTADAPGALILSPNSLQTLITKLSGSEYQLRVTVTDSAGLTASDTLNIGRDIQYQFTTEFTNDTQGDTQYENFSYRAFNLALNPSVVDSGAWVRVTCVHTAIWSSPSFTAGANPWTVCLVNVPGSGLIYQGLTAVKGYTFNFILRPGAPLAKINLNSYCFVSDPTAVGKVSALQQLTITGEVITNPIGTIVNQPIIITSNANK